MEPNSLAPELYFLIAKFLSEGPCRNAATVLKAELEEAKILPQRLDWMGNKHSQTFDELEKQYSHISGQHLLQICSRIGPVLEKEVPACIAGVISLLGAGKQSLLRTKEDMMKFFCNITGYSARYGEKPFSNLSDHSQVLNIAKLLQGRENSGPLNRREVVPTSFYSKLQLYRHTLGHLSAVYCVLFDGTGRYVITGADDLLVKVWSSTDGRLLATFRGASAEIMDIAVNLENTLLAAGSLDRIIRVWCFQTMSPIAVLSGHSGMITSVNFCPIMCNSVNYLVSTSSDGSVAFWLHSQNDSERFVFQPKPIQYHEKMRPGQAQMICASFSAGGAFMAAGSADHHVRVYMMTGEEGPRRVLEHEAHSDTVDSIQWAHRGLRFTSGSKDGTANLWYFEQQHWQYKKLLMSSQLAGESEKEDDSTKKTRVTMVCWDASDDWLVTAISDGSLKVWNSNNAELVKILRAHKDEVFVLESHPIDPRLVLSAGHDGLLIIWDVLKTEPIASFQNFIEGQGNGAVFDAKWSPDGTKIAATDSHGHLMMYGFGSGGSAVKFIPKELFFHTDYRPLIRDANNYVLDEQTQTAPHLMPPAFLVDVDGNPYPPAMQRLVPGRETCQNDQLVPNISVGASGHQEVVDGLLSAEIGQVQPRSNIDRLIEALAQRQLNHIDNMEVENLQQGQGNEQVVQQIVSPRASNRVSGLRREGDIEGVRQSSGDWQRDNTTPWNKPILAKPLNPALLHMVCKHKYAMADMELEFWKREMRRRPQISPDIIKSKSSGSGECNKNNSTAKHGYRTRATCGNEEDYEEVFDNPEDTSSSETSNESFVNEEELCSDSSTTDCSSDYSDWVGDHSDNLEPPKRLKRKPVQKRIINSANDNKKNRQAKNKALPMVKEYSADVPEIYRPPEWLSEVIPRKAPYYPQMGDEIVYFQQGHKRYLDAVETKQIYDISRCNEPWTQLELKAQEFVKVIGIKYEIRPPRLCCLKLAQIDDLGHFTGVTFTIKYHDIPDVLDFLVLKQTFDNALERNWSEGNRFRCVIDDGWWTGEIISVQPLIKEFPDSYFLCFSIRWDSGETEFLSPWDLEPIDENRLPTEVGGAVPVLPEEIQETLYQPHSEEWPMGDREEACRCILHGLEEVMTLSIAEPFLAPVDLNIYPAYAYVIEYPIDLSTIKARFENRFYRRIAAAQFDVRYLATNAEKFNEEHSFIVKGARLITEICLRILKNATECDVTALYHELVDGYFSSDSELDANHDINKPSTSSQRPTRSSTRKHSRAQSNTYDWKRACQQLLYSLWQCEDSIPFRQPVNRLEHPDYYEVIERPIDLQIIKDGLLGQTYKSPLDFTKDVKVMFSNSKNYYTNTHSKIYSMTIRLSAMFEERIRNIVHKWKSSTYLEDNRCVNNSRSSPLDVSAISRIGRTSNDGNNDGDDSYSDSNILSMDRAGTSSQFVSSPDYEPQSLRLRRRNVSRKQLCSDSSSDDEDDSDSQSESSQSSSVVSSPRRRKRCNPFRTSSNDDSDVSEQNHRLKSKGKQTQNQQVKHIQTTRSNRIVKKRYVQEDDDDDADENDDVEDDNEDDDDYCEDEEEEDEDDAEHLEFDTEQSFDDSEENVSTRNKKNKKRPRKVKTSNFSSEDDEESTDGLSEHDAEINKQFANSKIRSSINNYSVEENEVDQNLRIKNVIQDSDENNEINGGEVDSDDSNGSAGFYDESMENNQVLSNVNPVARVNQNATQKVRMSHNSESSNGDEYINENYSPLYNKKRRKRNVLESDEDSCDTDASSTQHAAKKPYYGDVSDEDICTQGRENDSRKVSTTISSRGRIRKMTLKAMSALR